MTTRFLCPATDSTGGGPCMNPLPCDEHDIPNEQVGLLLYGNSYLHGANLPPKEEA